MQRAAAMAASGDRSTAIELLEQAVERAPDDTALLERIEGMLRADERYSEASGVLRRRIDLEGGGERLRQTKELASIYRDHLGMADEADMLLFRNMIAIIRDRVKVWAERGMTLEEIIAARPAVGWEARYGADSGPRTTRRFIETLYDEVTANQ